MMACMVAAPMHIVHHPAVVIPMTTRVPPTQPPPRHQINYDRGDKTSDLFEYAPDLRLFRVTGPTIPSFDIGNHHFGVYVHDEGRQRCVYAALWKLGAKMDRRTQERLTALLDRLSPLCEKARHVLIEQQRNMNYVAVRLQQHVLSYFELRWPAVTRHNVASDLKYRKLDGPLGKQKAQRKRWAVGKAGEMFLASGDSRAFAFLCAVDEAVKGDDVSDAYLQYRAWRLCMPTA